MSRIAVFKTQDPVSKAETITYSDGTVESFDTSGGKLPTALTANDLSAYRELAAMKLKYERELIEGEPVDSFTEGAVLYEVFANGDFRLTDGGFTSKRDSGSPLARRIAAIISVATDATLRKVAALGN